MTMMALLIVRSEAGLASAAVILASAWDIKQLGYYQRTGVKEAIMAIAKNIAKATIPSQRQSVQHDEYKVHCCNRGGLCALAFVDDRYPVNAALALLNKVLDEYLKTFGDSWCTRQADDNQPWNFLTEALLKYQDPAEVDMLLNTECISEETNTITADEKQTQFQDFAQDGSETFTNSDIAETIKRRKLSENEGEAARNEEVHEEDIAVAGSEEIEKQIAYILEKIERFTEQVSEVLEAGKTLYKELSNDFEERVIAIHRQQVEAWQDDIKELRLLDEVNMEAVRRLQHAMNLLPTSNQPGWW